MRLHVVFTIEKSSANFTRKWFLGGMRKFMSLQRTFWCILFEAVLVRTSKYTAVARVWDIRSIARWNCSWGRSIIQTWVKRRQGVINDMGIVKEFLKNLVIVVHSRSVDTGALYLYSEHSCLQTLDILREEKAIHQSNITLCVDSGRNMLTGSTYQSSWNLFTLIKQVCYTVQMLWLRLLLVMALKWLFVPRQRTSCSWPTGASRQLFQKKIFMCHISTRKNLFWWVMKPGSGVEKELLALLYSIRDSIKNRICVDFE